MSPPRSLSREDQFRDIGDFLVAGLSLLDEMRAGNSLVNYSDWANRLCGKARLDEDSVMESRLMWLWDAIRTEPQLSQQFSDLLPAAAPWRNRDDRFKVFDAGEWFVIGMKGSQVTELLKLNRKPWEESVAVQTKKTLFMKPGKGGRLECNDCEALVTIRVTEVSSVEREADIMRIEHDRITLGNGFVQVRVDSLNQAYTVSSRRLEPERRSHGGRTYDHVVHATETKRIRLEDIRQEVERGVMGIPSPVPAKSQPGENQLFP